MLYQTHSGWEHLRLLDDQHEGCAATMNTLADQARGDWLLPLADDDLLTPSALRTLLGYTKGADVVFSPPLVWGLSQAASAHFYADPPAIPSFCLIRASVWKDCGGYDQDWHREEDRRFWIRALEAEARFVKCEEGPTWIYRHHGGNKSFNNGVAS